MPYAPCLQLSARFALSGLRKSIDESNGCDGMQEQEMSSLAKPGTRLNLHVGPAWLNSLAFLHRAAVAGIVALALS